MMPAPSLAIVAVCVIAVLAAVALAYAAGRRANGPEYALLRTRSAENADLQSRATVLIARIEELVTKAGDQKAENSRLAALLEAEQAARRADQEALLEVGELRRELLAAHEQCAALRPQAERLAEVEDAVTALTSRMERGAEERASLLEEKARLGAQLQEAAGREADGERLVATFREVFDSLAAQALRDNNGAFIELARETLTAFQANVATGLEAGTRGMGALVEPVSKGLEKLEGALQALEKDRIGAYFALTAQVEVLEKGQVQLTAHTANLVKALRAPSARGRWGEIGLKRVMEMAGMVEHCDFTEQVHVSTDDGCLRPDAIVHLPGEKSMVVDAKVPLTAYLDALEAEDETTKKNRLREHARLTRKHVSDLAGKAYWEELSCSPEFVIMYVPLETAFAAAVQEDPSLIDFAVERCVIPAGPLTLLAHLKAVAYGWRQERITANAQRISDLGRDLYNRLGTLATHFSAMGRHLGNTIDAYNAAVGSLERRVLVQARRFTELGAATGEDLEQPDPVDVRPRELQTVPGTRASSFAVEDVGEHG